MALEGLPGATPLLRAFVQSVRLYMRDYPELNRLVAGEESSDRQIAFAVLDALDDFNGTPHFTTLDLSSLLYGYRQANLLRRMTVESLLESIGLLQTRNHLTYNNGGFNVGINDKTPLIMQWLSYYKATTDQMKTKVKVAINIEGILGPQNHGVYSEYSLVNTTYASY